MRKFNLRKFVLLPAIWVAGAIVALYFILILVVSINKERLLRYVTQTASDRLKGKLTIAKAELSFFSNFPNVSVLLKDVSLADSMVHVHRHTFFEAGEVYAQIGLFSLASNHPPLKGITVKEGSIYLFTDSNGYSNDYLLGTKGNKAVAPEKSRKESFLQNVILQDVSITLEDLVKGKRYEAKVAALELQIDNNLPGLIQFDVDMKLQVHQLAFNLNRGSYLENQPVSGSFRVSYSKPEKILLFEQIKLHLGGYPFTLSGRFGLSEKDHSFRLVIDAKQVPYDHIRQLLTKRISQSLSIVQLSKPMDAVANISGTLRGGDPLVTVNWSATHSGLKTLFMDFENASFTGTYHNEMQQGLPRKDPNSAIVIKGFRADWHGLPVHSTKMLILDLSQPTLDCDLQSNFPLVALNDLLAVSSFECKQGAADVSLYYKGPLTFNDQTNSFLNGTAKFSNGSMLYTPRNVILEELNAGFSFRNSDLYADTLSTIIMGNQFMMKGEAKQLLTLLPTAPNNIRVNWSVYSPSINLQQLRFLLSKRKNAVRKSNQTISHIAAKMDDWLEQGTVHVRLNADALHYDKFHAKQVVADISLKKDSYEIGQLSMHHAGGQLGISGSLKSREDEYMQADIKAQLKQVNVQELFRGFDNFGQDGIMSHQLAGNLTADLTAGMAINEHGKVYPQSVVSEVNFSLKDGELNHFEPIKKIQQFIFKKRNFDNIRFAELKNVLSISNQQIRFRRMEIQSNVLTMFTEGTYAMNGNSDITIQLPLSNLRKRDAAYTPRNKGVNQKTGASIFLKGNTGADGNIQFTLDVLHRLRKKD